MKTKLQESESYLIILYGKRLIPNDVIVPSLTFHYGYEANTWIEKPKIKSDTGMGIYISDAKELIDLLDMLLAHQSYLKSMGVREIVVDVKIDYKTQCNWSLNKDEIKKLHQLKAILTLSAYRA